jgi:glycerophosphoryl diester phosphodiesterase
VSLPAQLWHDGKAVLLKYHKFNSGLELHPPNGLAALEHVLEGGVSVIECDIAALADETLVLMHDETLERETTGVGPVASIGVAAFKALCLRGSEEPPATLVEVVERLRVHEGSLKVQIDVKAALPLAEAAATQLLRALEPLRERPQLQLVFGCLGDWNLRMLRRLDPGVGLGFDPAFHLHAPVPGPEPFMMLPTRVNAYGYVDDHPLGHRRVMPAAGYLRARFEELVQHVPGAVEYYLHRGFVTQALDDGFDPIRFIQRETGALVDVWTLNRWDAGIETELPALLAAGADQITTDSAVLLAAMLREDDGFG